MTRTPAKPFPQLQRVFSGYLHEDVIAQHGTPEAALRAFRKDASTTELRRFRTEVKRFLAHIGTLEFDQVRDLVAQLGSRWIPPSREALVALLTNATSRSPAPPA